MRGGGAAGDRKTFNFIAIAHAGFASIANAFGTLLT